MNRLIAAALVVAALALAAPVAAPQAQAQCRPPNCWAAIVWSTKSRDFWVVNNVTSPEEAEDRALARCRGCNEVKVFRNACFAVYSAPGGGFGASQAASEHRARRRARRACHEYNPGKRCRLLTAACTLRSYVDY